MLAYIVEVNPVEPDICAPREKSRAIASLSQVAKDDNRPKNGIAPGVLKRHFSSVAPITLGEFGLGRINPATRADIFKERLNP
ncbi:MAG TPA: hypothetical protein GX509_09545 [Firmicutes bacterium]|nr:hypothetical protein [Bacillota bacterium]